MSTVNKSSISNVINEFTSALKKHVIKPNEALSEKPSSFLGLHTSTLGKLNAYSYMNMLMSKQEIVPSLAILSKSLMRYISSDKLGQIFGQPSETVLVIALSEKAIIDNAYKESLNRSKLTINKNIYCSFSDSFPKFTLSHNIDIYLTSQIIDGKETYNIYATYDVNDIECEGIYSIDNKTLFVTSRNDIIIDDQKMFVMYVPIKQMKRSYHYIELSGENKDINIEYDNSIIGFNVLYSTLGSNKYNKIPIYMEGEQQSDGLNYSLTDNGGIKNLRLKFSKLPGSFDPESGSIKIIVYTTEGSKGNFTFSEDILNDETKTESIDINFQLNQDISVESQSRLNGVTISVSTNSSEAYGGRDQLGIEELRSIVINGANTSKVITPSSLVKLSKEKDLTSVESRYDILSHEYKLLGYISDKKGNIVPTKTITGEFSADKFPINVETGCRLFTPNDIFVKTSENDNGEIYDCVLAKDNKVTYKKYVEDYKLNKNNQNTFPYFINIKSKDTLSLSIINEAVNKEYPTEFSFISDDIFHKLSITQMAMYRNPISNRNIVDNNGFTSKEKDFYIIRFNVGTDKTIIDNLKALSDSVIGPTLDPVLKLKVVINNKSDKSKYVAEVDPSRMKFSENDNTFSCEVLLETNSSILNDNKINITNNSIRKLPYKIIPISFYYLDRNVDLEIACIFKSPKNTIIHNNVNYLDYLSEKESTDNYYTGLIYKIKNVSFFEDITSTFNLPLDIRLGKSKYELAKEDIPEKYEQNVYKKDKDGKFEFEYVELTDLLGNPININDDGVKAKQYILLHKAGDDKRHKSGKVGTYRTITQGIAGESPWSEEETDSSSGKGIFNSGDILLGEQITGHIHIDGLIILFGTKGKIACYDTVKNLWVNELSSNRDESRVGLGKKEKCEKFVYNDGGVMGNATIYGAEIIKIKEKDKEPESRMIMFYGDMGRVCYYNLKTHKWRSYNSVGDNEFALFTDGKVFDYKSIYSHQLYYKNISANNGEFSKILFGCSDGVLITYDISESKWYYPGCEEKYSPKSIYGDGTGYMNNCAIFTMKRYDENNLFIAGNKGNVAIVNLSEIDPSKSLKNISSGEVTDGEPIYDSLIKDTKYIVAGKKGKVANYDIINSFWNKCGIGKGLTSCGKEFNNKNVNKMFNFKDHIIFGCDTGIIRSYDIVKNEWSDNIKNDGDFLKGDISDIFYYDLNRNLIYFTTKGGNTIYKYRKGDIIKDENGRPKIIQNSEIIYILKDIPVFDRVYSISNKYFEILENYDTLFKKIQEFKDLFIDGCSISLGLHDTVGDSNTFKFANKQTGEINYLDSINISLKLGFKFSKTTFDETKVRIISESKIKMIDYIKNIQTSNEDIITLNVYEMINSIKQQYKEIEYFEYYSLNGYSSEQCQTIYWDKTEDKNEKEYLSIKQTVDEINSDFDNEKILFIPDIEIKML